MREVMLFCVRHVILIEQSIVFVFFFVEATICFLVLLNFMLQQHIYKVCLESPPHGGGVTCVSL